MSELQFRQPPLSGVVSLALHRAFSQRDEFLDGLPIGIYACDLAGAVVQFNRRAVELWGRAPSPAEGARFCGALRAFHLDGQPLPPDQTPMAELLRTGKPIRGRKVIVERPDGTFITILANLDPLRDEKGELVGGVNCFQDITDVERIQQALRDQDQRLAVTYEHATIGIAEVDAEGRRMRVNETACTITGRSREELVGGSIFNAPFIDDAEADRKEFMRLVAGDVDRYSIEKRVMRKDQRVIWIALTTVAIRDAMRKFMYGVRIFQDVTEQKATADALRESEQRLAATYEHAAIAISEIDAEGRLLRVNETVSAITGYSRDELLKLSVFDITHPDDRTPDLYSYREQTHGDRDRYGVEKRLICKDGRVIWVTVVSSTVRDSAGRFLYGIRVMQDITKRKHADELLRESERRYRELIEALPAAVYTTDGEGRITYFNQGAVDLWGCEPKLNDTKWCGSWRLYWPDGTPMPHDQCPMAQALREERPIRDAEAVAERPDGTRVPFIPYPTPLRDASGALVGAVNMLVDITERKQAESRQKLLVDELNHRVKNTLATVQSLASQTARHAPSPKVFYERLEGRLIALSRAHDQLSRRNWAHADLLEIAAASLAPYRHETPNQMRISGEPIKLEPRMAVTFAMVFHELATNAVKYGALSQSGGELDLSWTVVQNGAGEKLQLCWREQKGPPVKPPQRRGFGSLLVERGVGTDLGGAARLDFQPTGVVCNIEIPLTGER